MGLGSFVGAAQTSTNEDHSRLHTGATAQASMRALVLGLVAQSGRSL
jgi:hypothetical protein